MPVGRPEVLAGAELHTGAGGCVLKAGLEQGEQVPVLQGAQRRAVCVRVFQAGYGAGAVARG